jgi:hypothetical protein
MKTCTFNPATHAIVPIELLNAVDHLIKGKGRFHTEQNFNALKSAHFDYSTWPEYPADAGWVSAKDRLPISKEMIICAREKIDGGWALDLNYWTVSNRWGKEYTHWMPLPPAPEAPC